MTPLCIIQDASKGAAFVSSMAASASLPHDILSPPMVPVDASIFGSLPMDLDSAPSGSPKVEEPISATATEQGVENTNGKMETVSPMDTDENGAAALLSADAHTAKSESAASGSAKAEPQTESRDDTGDQVADDDEDEAKAQRRAEAKAARKRKRKRGNRTITLDTLEELSKHTDPKVIEELTIRLLLEDRNPLSSVPSEVRRYAHQRNCD